MDFKGRMLTSEEAISTRAHYSKNSGIPWDIEEIATLVFEGGTAIENDETTKQEIEKGLKLLVTHGGNKE